MSWRFFKFSGEELKKFFLNGYFIFFILLNVLDFLNFLSGDVDFFKKILSWFLIGMVFYKASFTKIFVGKRDRFFDLVFIFGFCLMGIVKSIFHYLKMVSVEEFKIFYFFLKLFPSSSEPFLTNSFVLGVVVVVLASFFLIRRIKVKRRSLIGSFNISGYWKFIGGEFIVLSFVAIFFGLVVFNFLMEWFALAVDAIILVLGLVYYLFLFVHKHTVVNTDKLLSSISNTGNSFYHSLIFQFSNKRSFMIGVSFVLVLHLLVDVGVYLVPFVTGLSNGLYGNLVVDAVSIFNLKSFVNSHFYTDLSLVGWNFGLGFTIFLIDICCVVLFLILMVAPFYYFYLNVLKKKSVLSRWIEFIFIFALGVVLFAMSLPSLRIPIEIGLPDSNLQITGVDLDVFGVVDVVNSDLKFVSFELMLVLLVALFLIYEIRILMKSNINLFVRKKILPSLVLIFFVCYMSIFFYTTVRTEIEANFFSDWVVSDSKEFETIMGAYSESVLNDSKVRVFSPQIASTKFFELEFVPFSTVNFENLSKEHIDFLILNVQKIDTSYEYEIFNHKSRAVFNEEFRTVSEYFNSGDFWFVYKLGSTGFEFERVGESLNSIRISKINFNLKDLISLKKNNRLKNVVEISRMVVLIVFYLFGLVEFTKHFFRRNVLMS